MDLLESVSLGLTFLPWDRVPSRSSFELYNSSAEIFAFQAARRMVIQCCCAVVFRQPTGHPERQPARVLVTHLGNPNLLHFEALYLSHRLKPLPDLRFPCPVVAHRSTPAT